MGKRLELPKKGSAEYKKIRGEGVFKGAFDSGIYIMDGHEVCYIYFINLYTYYVQ